MYTYVATEEEKEQLDEIINGNTKELEEKYDPNKIFGDNKTTHHNEEELEEIEASLIEKESNEKSIWSKIVEFFHKLFNK